MNRNIAIWTALLWLSGCGGGGSGSGDTTPPDTPVVSSVTVTCTPAKLQTSGTSQCTANLRGTGAFDSSVRWSVEGGGEIDPGGSFVAPARAATITITATSVSHANAFGSVTVTVWRPRSLVDLPDDDPGHQVHILYVVPSDGEDRELDTNGSIELSVEAWNEWFASQTGGRRLRLDRVDGALDVTFVRLGRTNAEINAHAPYVLDHLETELVLKGFNVPDKIYHVYYDGGDERTGTCGDAFRPPTSPGTFSAIYLNAVPTGGAPCNTYYFAPSGDAPGHLEFTSLHEIVHVLGFVPDCARNSTAAGHASDSNTDLMYAGSAAWTPSVVDFNGDDYFDADLANCLDLADSAFLDPLPAAEILPPGWPYDTLEIDSCDREVLSRSTSPDTTTPRNIQFLNGTGAPINVYWLDYSGTRQFYGTVQPHGYRRQLTYETHPWVLTNETNRCLGIYRVGNTFGRAIVRAPSGDPVGGTKLPSVGDLDGDGIPNVSDPDDDNDGVPDTDDPCPMDSTGMCGITSTVASLELSGATPLTFIGETIDLSATANMRDGSSQAIEGSFVHWVSSDTAVATVIDGTVTAVGPGNAMIVASYQGAKTSADAPVYVSLHQTGTVRVLYAVPLDREFRTEYRNAIRHAVVDLQSWYRQQLGGLTFSLYDATPEQCQLRESSEYYRRDTWGKLVEGLQHCAPVRRGTSEFTWIVYADMNTDCDAEGSLGRGGLGITMLPDEDLEGLIGNRLIYYGVCGGGPWPGPVTRWIGGLGHELGHALGLPHPPGCDEDLADVCDRNALMAGGYGDYPNTYLRPDDKERLSRSPFIGRN